MTNLVFILILFRDALTTKAVIRLFRTSKNKRIAVSNGSLTKLSGILAKTISTRRQTSVYKLSTTEVILWKMENQINEAARLGTEPLLSSELMFLQRNRMHFAQGAEARAY